MIRLMSGYIISLFIIINQIFFPFFFSLRRFLVMVILYSVVILIKFNFIISVCCTYFKQYISFKNVFIYFYSGFGRMMITDWIKLHAQTDWMLTTVLPAILPTYLFRKYPICWVTYFYPIRYYRLKIFGLECNLYTQSHML